VIIHNKCEEDVEEIKKKYFENPNKIDVKTPTEILEERRLKKLED
jgi:hypothetical protein